MRTLRLPDPFPRGRPREKLEFGSSAWAADSCLVEWSNLERQWLEPEPAGRTRSTALPSWGTLIGRALTSLPGMLLNAVLRNLLRGGLSLVIGAAAGFVLAAALALGGLFMPTGALEALTQPAVDIAGWHPSLGDLMLIGIAALSALGAWRLLGVRD